MGRKPLRRKGNCASVSQHRGKIIQDVDLALKALEIVYRENGAAVKGLSDRNVHRRKVVGKGKSVR